MFVLLTKLNLKFVEIFFFKKTFSSQKITIFWTISNSDEKVHTKKNKTNKFLEKF